MQDALQFSFIIPTHNEELSIATCIEHIQALGLPSQIVVCDASSNDETVTIAESMGAEAISGPLNRGLQLNLACQVARGQVLVFVHADTALPPDAQLYLTDFLHDRHSKIALFRVKVDIDHWILRWYSFCSRFDSILTKFADHCIVVRRDFFQSLGGFSGLRYMEDVVFLQKARRRSRIKVFPTWVYTSGRRFVQNGIIRQYLFDAVCVFKYLTGQSPEAISRHYTKTDSSVNFDAVCVFARYPDPGKVKTRLANSIGAVKATKIYRLLAEHTFSELKKLGSNFRNFLFVAEAADLKRASSWAGNHFIMLSQCQGDLGERIKGAIKSAISMGAKNVIIIGTDLPKLQVGMVEKALFELKSSDVVIGPSEDGGYYLIGVRKLFPEMFDTIDWGSDRVFDQTSEAIKQLGLSVAILPDCKDIDTLKDLEVFVSSSNSKLAKQLAVLCMSIKDETC